MENNKLICPFCQQELDKFGYYFGATPIFLCNNCQLFGGIKLWQELIRTRKALEVAKDTIIHADWFFDGDYNVDAKTMHSEIKCVVKAITALEQKDN